MEATDQFANTHTKDLSKSETATTVAGSAGAGALVGLCLLGPPGALIGAGMGAATGAATSQKSDMLSRAISGVAMPANGIQVQVDAKGQQVKGSVIYYAVDVYATSGQPWRVMKASQDFNVLHSTLDSACAPALFAAEQVMFGGTLFPRDPWFGVMSWDEKRSKLEAWLNAIVKKGNSRWDSTLNNFLELRAGVTANQQQQQQMQMQQPAMSPKDQHQALQMQPAVQEQIAQASAPPLAIARAVPVEQTLPEGQMPVAIARAVPVKQILPEEQIPVAIACAATAGYAAAAAPAPPLPAEAPAPPPQQPQTQPVADPVAPAAASPQQLDGGGIVGRLKELVALHQCGALTDEEFANAKAQVLANK